MWVSKTKTESLDVFLFYIQISTLIELPISLLLKVR